MERPLISVIVPVYNGETTLHKCVESIVNQTYKNIEILLVNDGSKDSSLDICRELEQKYDVVKVIDKLNEGVSKTRNRGIAESTGKYITFVDCDDYIDEDMLSSMTQSMEEKNADVCICAMTLHKDREELVKELKEVELDSKEDIAKHLINIYRTNYINSPCNKLYKKDLMDKVFPEDISLGEDLLFNISYLSNCKKAVCINKGFYHYQFVNNNSLTSRYRTDNFQIAARLYEAVTAYGKDNGVSFSHMRPVREVFMNSVFYAIQDLYYYCKDDGKKKKETLKGWAKNALVREALIDAGNIGVQKKLVAKMLKCKFYVVIKMFFTVKKLISKLAH